MTVKFDEVDSQELFSGAADDAVASPAAKLEVLGGDRLTNQWEVLETDGVWSRVLVGRALTQAPQPCSPASRLDHHQRLPGGPRPPPTDTEAIRTGGLADQVEDLFTASSTRMHRAIDD